MSQAPTAAADRSSLAISALWIYPIKSAKGISCMSAELTGSGFFYDRMFMVVKEATGKFVTQRDQPKMALVSPSLPPEALLKGWGALEPGSLMMVSAPGMLPLSVPLTLQEPQEQQFRSVTCWEWVGQALDMGEDAATWFSQLLGMRCRLMRYLGTSPATSVPHDASAALQPLPAAQGGGPPARFSSPEFADGFETRFSDGYPMHLTTEASLLDLNARVGRPQQMLQFRPNIVVSGSAPWEEDRWGEVRVLSGAGGKLSLRFVKPCDRCKITTLDPATGETEDAEPLTTLGTFRSGQLLGWAEQQQQKTWKHALFFGWNVVSEQTGSLAVGDRLEVVTA